MKNAVVLVSIILLIFIMMFLPIIKANVIVSPAEIFLTMTEMYIEGNTTKKITITNQYYHDISVVAWMKHPDIIEWMRQNRTLIDNISWINIEPLVLVIPSNTSNNFYIHLSIPNEIKNQTLSQHWETWAAFKINYASENASSSLKEGYLVRIYIDTPSSPFMPKDKSSTEQLIQDTLIAFSIAIIITLIYYFYRGKKKNKKL